MIDDSKENPNDVLEPGNEGDAPRRRSRRRGRRGKARVAASDVAEPQAELVADAPAPSSPARQPRNHEAPRPSEQRRAVKSGFGDDIDRQVCLARLHGYPTIWPANYREGLAVQPLIEVGKTAEAVLLCDLSHDGPCVWPGHLGIESREVPETAPVSERLPVAEESDETMVTYSSGASDSED